MQKQRQRGEYTHWVINMAEILEAIHQYKKGKTTVTLYFGLGTNPDCLVIILVPVSPYGLYVEGQKC